MAFIWLPTSSCHCGLYCNMKFFKVASVLRPLQKYSSINWSSRCCRANSDPWVQCNVHTCNVWKLYSRKSLILTSVIRTCIRATHLYLITACIQCHTPFLIIDVFWCALIRRVTCTYLLRVRWLLLVLVGYCWFHFSCC